MKINGVELEDLDVFDADVLEKYEKAMDKVQAEMKEISKMSSNAVSGIRKQCQSIFDCFNSLFGVGTDKKIFGDKVNLLTCLKAFSELVENINDQRKELTRLTSKYTNRAARRSKSK